MKATQLATLFRRPLTKEEIVAQDSDDVKMPVLGVSARTGCGTDLGRKKKQDLNSEDWFCRYRFPQSLWRHG